LEIIEDYLPYLASVEHCLDHGIFMLDKEIGILSRNGIDSSDFVAMYIDRLKVTESAENRTADYLL
jgi:hypothetical protein